MNEPKRETMFEVLANRHRRHLLIALRTQNPQRVEGSLPQNMPVGDKKTKDLQAAFYHNHLPRLDAAGFITWNRDTNEIVRGPDFDTILPFLAVIENCHDELADC